MPPGELQNDYCWVLFLFVCFYFNASIFLPPQLPVPTLLYFFSKGKYEDPHSSGARKVPGTAVN